VHDHADAWVLLAHEARSAAPRTACAPSSALPEQHARITRRLGRQPTPRLRRVPHDHLVERHAHLVRGVAAEVLVGQEQDPLPALPRPAQHGRAVRRGADDAAVLADERLDGRRRVDVGDGHHVVNAHLAELAPADLELLGIGHVGHRAAGGEVGQDDLLVRRAQDVGALGHEVHAAEDDVVGFGARRTAARGGTSRR
jgi:hypothetical protein